MPLLSHLGMSIPAGAIRGLDALAHSVKQNGTKVLHMNIGQPDIPAPQAALDSLKSFDLPLVPYGPSGGILDLKIKLEKYYKSRGTTISHEDILVTQGASEAIHLTLLTILNPGDEVIVFEPFYANFSLFIKMVGGKMVAIPSILEKGYALPNAETIESYITSKTKAILINNPCNPTGYVYSKEELELLVQIARHHHLFLLSDEVYSDFIYSDKPFISLLDFDQSIENTIIFDSSSKRFSLCGARIGNIVSRNQNFVQATERLCQVRLSPPVIDQRMVSACLNNYEDYLAKVRQLYINRRNLLVKLLDKIDYIQHSFADGAFYLILTLPVEDSFDYCRWLLSDYQENGYTLMMAPASGFYGTAGAGRNQVRIAYVLEEEEIVKAVNILRNSLPAYPGFIVKEAMASH
jgi:aspartate aminotransferase